MARNFSVALSLLLNSAQYTQALRGAANQTQSFRSKIMGAFLPIAGIAALGASIKAMIGTIFEQTKKLDSLNAGYKSVITNSDELAKTYATLDGMAENYGVSINTLKTEYLAFAAASKGTSLEGEEAMKVFDALTFSMGKLGASEESTHRALIAVTQMMSKGTVASEELRGQLGEALPGAFNLAAKAMGTTTMGLGKMLKLGEVSAAVMLPKLAQELNKTYRDGSGKIDTLTASQGRYSTALTKLISDIEAAQVFKPLIDSGTKFLGILDEITKSDGFKNWIKETATELNDVLYVAMAKNITLWQKLGILINKGLPGNSDESDRMIKRAKELDEFQQRQKDAKTVEADGTANLIRLNKEYNESLKPKTTPKVVLTDEQQEKAAKEAFERESALLEKAKTEQLILITDQLRNQEITEGIFKKSEIQASIEFYKKQIELLKKFSKDSTAVQLQLSQARSSLIDASLMIGKTGQPAVSDSPAQTPYEKASSGKDDLQGIFSAQKIYADRVKEQEAIEKAAKEREDQVKDLNDQLKNLIGSSTSEMGATFGESIGKMLGGMDASEAFDGFGNSILQMIGQFLISLGSALISYGIVMNAFFTDMEPGTKILIGAAAVVAGGILMGIASAGPKGSSSMGAGGSSGGSSSGASSYSSPQAQNINISGQFELKGNNLVAAISNVSRKNTNIR